MTKTKYNFFQLIYMAVAKPMQYFRLTRAGGARMTGFVFLFVFLTSLFTLVPDIYSVVGPNGYTKLINQDVPAFEFSHGELWIAERFEEVEGFTYVLIDTDVQNFTTDDISDLYDQVILISRTNMIVYQYGKTQELDFSTLEGISFDNGILDLFTPLLYLGIVLYSIFVYVVKIAAYFLTALLYSLVGLIVVSATNSRMKYGAVFATAIYGKVTAAILAVVLHLVELIASVDIPGLVTIGISILVTCAYVVYGTLSHNSEEAREDNTGVPPENYTPGL